MHSFPFALTCVFIISVSLITSFCISFLISTLVFILRSSLNESQYDGKVIDGEEAVSKATIEPLIQETRP